VSDLQSLCKSSCEIVGRRPKVELLKVTDGLDAAIVLYHSYSVHSWMAPAFRLRGYEDAASIRGTGLNVRSKERKGSWFEEVIAL
jgi:hypothetical protein